MTATVSVVIPCFDAEDVVEEAVLSVSRQTVRTLQLVCVDDGSTDGTLARLRALRRGGVRLEIVTTANRGACHARNCGARRCLGDYIQFLDADDVLDPEKLASQLRSACTDDGPADVVCGAGRTLVLEGHEEFASHGYVDVWAGLVASRLGTTSSMLWRREALDRVGGWSEGLRASQEYDLLFRMMASGARVVLDHAPLTLRRIRPSSIQMCADASSSRRIENIVLWLQLRQRIAAHLQRHAALDGHRLAVYVNAVHRMILNLPVREMAFATHRELVPDAARLWNGAPAIDDLEWCWEARTGARRRPSGAATGDVSGVSA